MIEKMLSDAGYSDQQIQVGLAYARQQGAEGFDEIGQLALSRILLTDSQLENGERVGWEPVPTE